MFMYIIPIKVFNIFKKPGTIVISKRITGRM